jgi:outer membrane protein TolC
MIKSILTSIGIFILSFAYSQHARLETSTFNPNVDSVAEALVALAMNSPSVRSSEHFANQFKYLYQKSKTAWLNNIVVQGNLNEYSIKNLSGSSDPLKQSTQYPRYNVGVSVPLGIFVNNPKQTKSDYNKYLSTVDQIDAEKRNVREQVLTSYHNYLMNKQLLALGQQLVHDWELIYLSHEDKFKKGEISLDVFYSTTRIYNDQLNRQVTVSASLRNDEAKLENLIGMNVNDAINMINSRKR